MLSIWLITVDVAIDQAHAVANPQIGDAVFHHADAVTVIELNIDLIPIGGLRIPVAFDISCCSFEIM